MKSILAIKLFENILKNLDLSNIRLYEISCIHYKKLSIYINTIFILGLRVFRKLQLFLKNPGLLKKVLVKILFIYYYKIINI